MGELTGCQQSNSEASQAATPASAPSSAGPSAAVHANERSASLTVEDEVLQNLRNQAIGRQTVADLNIPEAFLRREADRIIRSSFEDRARIVVKDPLAKTDDGQPPAPALDMQRRAAPKAIEISEPSLTPQSLAYRRSLQRGRPSNRGFRPRLGIGDALWPMNEPDQSADPSLRKAADLVGKRLAIDGLLPTLAQAIKIVGPERFGIVDETNLSLLREAGLPIDLLEHFTLVGGESGSAIVAFVASGLQNGQTFDAMLNELSKATFAFAATQPGFSVADDAGGTDIGAIRAQATRGGYWRGLGDGGTTDLIRQAMIALPDVPFVTSVSVNQARGFAETAATWPLEHDRQLTLVVEPLDVQQWTQDNAKAGAIDGRRLGMLVPRYASWGDDGSTFLPDQTFLLPGAAEAMDAQLIHSPLLFQGGNILCVQSPGTGERLLLVSDADVYRNTALGLTVPQTLEAFRVEFGCDRCEMLEAVSFHLDYDVSIRAMNDRTVAFVNDPIAAAKIVLEQGTGVLVAAGMIDGQSAANAISALKRDEYRAFLDLVAPIVYAVGANGQFPLSLAERFATSPMDSGVGNLQRYLLAMDLIVSRALPADQAPGDRHARSYLQSLNRRDRERESLSRRLGELGMEVVPVPSMSDALRSIAALNGLQIRGAFVMPAYGGLYAPVDAAAQAAVAGALGDAQIRILPIECSESQRRCGAVRCSLSVFPRLTQE